MFVALFHALILRLEPTYESLSTYDGDYAFYDGTHGVWKNAYMNAYVRGDRNGDAQRGHDEKNGDGPYIA